ncbi:tumor necrosis factor receptor superfamily member 6 isoform X2 [Talpa occidentalis]|uniref:tumor necrosis factor receptor superfamily member 6 isoform X2 n=1 Tax=Talpa occidentalis TaxID=50954 RepID=UPI001890B059|nr:tumor necrosis factor receptor superfamily member 6 isoform X2 [Talpa occidentalis]
MGRSSVLLPLILTAIVGSLPKDVNAQVTVNNSKAERECPRDLHRVGEKKVTDCIIDRGKPTCVPCLDGQEYTDAKHYSPKCRRCSICDAEHGLEVEKNCTRNQNTKCRCKANFFCANSACEYCGPCKECEDGNIENCTPTSSTKCKGSRHNLLGLCGLLILVPLSALIIYLICRWHRNKKKGHHEFVHPNLEMLDLTDIDLSKYITTIAEEMKITEVKEFVRKNGVSETKIDEIKNDHIQDTAEQKVQLLRNWYQIHGKKDACGTLISNLKKANLCLLADKIQDLISKDIANERKHADCKNDPERQNLV